MPENTVYVGRGSAYGNPFVVGKDGTAKECVDKYIKVHCPYTHTPPDNTMGNFLFSDASISIIQAELKGKNLACWCALDQPCHADWLLMIANSE